MSLVTSVLTILIVLILSVKAEAHEEPVGAFEAGTWTLDPWAVIPLLASAVLYLVGTQRLWRHAGYGRGVKSWQAACFWTGWCVTALALTSPLHRVGGRLFVAHMTEHEILMVVAAPLLVLSKPIAAFLWALPQYWRARFGRAAQVQLVAAGWNVLRDPWVATLLHGLVIWIWHMPALYQSVLTEVALHRLQHATFFFSALLFWWTLLCLALRQRGHGVAIACLFFTSLHTAMLGILLTLSPALWYPDQSAFAETYGLTPLEDQQLGGLVMWIPPGLIYLTASLWLASNWISESAKLSAQETTLTSY